MKRTYVLVLALLVAACSSDAITPDATPRADASPDGPPPPPRAIVVAPPANFGPPPGIMSTLDPATLAVEKNIGAGIVGSDPFLRHIGSKIYIINRGEANVTILDAATLTFEEQFATGAGTSPQDVAVVGDKRYVPALGSAGVVVATHGKPTVTTIDLGTPLGDPDGMPDCVSAYAVGTTVFVACGLFDPSFTARGPGKIAVIDATTDTFVTSITMPYENPQSVFVRTPVDSVFGGDLLIATEPNFGDLTQGCLVRVAVDGSRTASCAITNADAGGAQTHVDVQTSPEILWMAISASFTAASLRAFDLHTGMLVPGSISAAGQTPHDVAACSDGNVVVTDNTGNGGFRVFRNMTEVTTGELAIGLPPGFGNGLVCR